MGLNPILIPEPRMIEFRHIVDYAPDVRRTLK